MPLAAAHDYRASWEVPYDFHPRIRPYPGAKSVVRAYMDASLPITATAAAATGSNTKALRRRPPPPPRHYRLPASCTPVSTATAAAAAPRPPPPPPTAPTDSPPQPEAERSPRHSRVPRTRDTAPVCRSAWQHPQPAGTAAHASPAPPLKKPATTTAAPHDSGDQAADHGVSTSARPTPLAPATRVPQRPRRAATVGVGRRVPVSDPRPRLGELPHTVDDCATTPAAAAPAHAGYPPRTKLPYSLAPAYAAQCARWRQSPVPDITVADRFCSPPAAREYRLRARHVRRVTRAGFVDALRQSFADGGSVPAPADVVPHAVTAALTDAENARDFDAAQHNYNTRLVDAFADTVDERAAHLQATEERMWERLILHVEPLSAAHQRVVAAGGASVLDDGHVIAPIHVSAAPDGEDMGDGGEAAMAVVVQPFADELPRSVEALRQTEAQRRWPKGREWDRQAAIQSAVGSTAQEAIIDLGIDPRYRQPGERPGRRRGRRLHGA